MKRKPHYMLEGDSWSVSKCLRVIRPLGSRLKAFRDQIHIYPSIIIPKEEASIGDWGSYLASWSTSCVRRLPVYTRRAMLNKSQRSTVIKQKKTVYIESDGSSDGADSESDEEFQMGLPTPPVWKKSGRKKRKIDSDPFSDDTSIEPSPVSCDNILYHIKSWVTEEAYSNYIDIFKAFKHFLSQFDDLTPSKLIYMSAFEVGRCIIYTEYEVEEISWYESFVSIDLYRHWVCLGHGIGLLIQNSKELDSLLIVLCSYCVEIEAFGLARLLLDAYVNVIDPTKFWINFNTLQYIRSTCKAEPNTFLKWISNQKRFVSNDSQLYIGSDQFYSLLYSETSNVVYPAKLINNALYSIVSKPQKKMSITFLKNLFSELLFCFINICKEGDIEGRVKTIAQQLVSIIPRGRSFYNLRLAFQLYACVLEQNYYNSIIDDNDPVHFIRLPPLPNVDENIDNLSEQIISIVEDSNIIIRIASIVLPFNSKLALIIAGAYLEKSPFTPEVKIWIEELGAVLSNSIEDLEEDIQSQTPWSSPTKNSHPNDLDAWVKDNTLISDRCRVSLRERRPYNDQVKSDNTPITISSSNDRNLSPSGKSINVVSNIRNSLTSTSGNESILCEINDIFSNNEYENEDNEIYLNNILSDDHDQLAFPKMKQPSSTISNKIEKTNKEKAFNGRLRNSNKSTRKTSNRTKKSRHPDQNIDDKLYGSKNDRIPRRVSERLKDKNHISYEESESDDNLEIYTSNRKESKRIRKLKIENQDYLKQDSDDDPLISLETGPISRRVSNRVKHTKHISYNEESSSESNDENNIDSKSSKLKVRIIRTLGNRAKRNGVKVKDSEMSDIQPETSFGNHHHINSSSKLDLGSTGVEVQDKTARIRASKIIENRSNNNNIRSELEDNSIDDIVPSRRTRSHFREKNKRKSTNSDSVFDDHIQAVKRRKRRTTS